ncbi:MAG: hypothetical protein HY343_01480 [Lentisphaerae bacterium]|nr:hypothetical protein [Lentisphaerota bacterium]
MKKKELQDLESFADKAEQALRDAVKGVIEEHRRSGIPLAMMRHGKAMLVPPEEVGLPVVAEAHTEYQIRQQTKRPRK